MRGRRSTTRSIASRFAETIFKGAAAEPFDLAWSTSSPAYVAGKNAHFAYDLDRARNLLQQAGVSNVQAHILVNAAAGPQLLAFAAGASAKPGRALALLR